MNATVSAPAAMALTLERLMASHSQTLAQRESGKLPDAPSLASVTAKLRQAHLSKPPALAKQPSLAPLGAPIGPISEEEPEAPGDAGPFAAALSSAAEAPVRPSAAPLLGAAAGLAACQGDENDAAEVVVVAEPEAGVGSLHPRGALYERPVNSATAQAQHAKFRQALSDAGLRVLTVREILGFGVEDAMGPRLELEGLAARALTYQLAQGVNASQLSPDELYFLSDDYKAEVLAAMSTQQLIEACLINPTVTLVPSGRDTGLTASYSFEPLSNLVYTRDQQITTPVGLVMARLRSAQRAREVQLMAYCWHKLGLSIAGAITAPGFLEGGDFFPLASRDLCLLGVGLRSNVEAAQQLMDGDLLGTNRLAVVRDDLDRHQDRMHLDCVFSVLSDSAVIMLRDIIGAASPQRRLVDEYVRRPGSSSYVLTRRGVELSAFIQGEGFSVIPITAEHQLAYACNVLNLGRGRILSVHEPSTRQVLRHPAARGCDVRLLDFSAVTSMYGSVHCASQVVRRTPPAQPRALHPAAAAAVARAQAAADAAQAPQAARGERGAAEAAAALRPGTPPAAAGADAAVPAAVHTPAAGSSGGGSVLRRAQSSHATSAAATRPLGALLGEGKKPAVVPVARAAE